MMGLTAWQETLEAYTERYGEPEHGDRNTDVVIWEVGDKTLSVRLQAGGWREVWTVQLEHFALYHRDDGPAVVYYHENGTVRAVYWYYKDQSCTFERWWEEMGESEKKKRALLWL